MRQKTDKNKKELKENIKILESFIELSNNWDGEGACGFSEEFIEFVSNILVYLEIQPDVFPLQNGNIVLEFGNVKNKYLEIIISPQKQMNIYKKDGMGNTEKHSHISYSLEFINHELMLLMLYNL